MTQTQITEITSKIGTIKNLVDAVNEAADLMESIKSGEINLKKLKSDIAVNEKKVEDSKSDVKKAEKVVANARAQATIDIKKLEAIHEAALEDQAKKLTARLEEHNKEVNEYKKRVDDLSSKIKEKTGKVTTLDKEATVLSNRITQFNAQMNELISNATGK